MKHPRQSNPNKLYLHKTNNSDTCFSLKVFQRIKKIKELNKKEINVLDAYCGDGLIWKEIIKRMPEIKFNLTNLDIKKGWNNNYTIVKNDWWILRNDVKCFDIVDLDAHHCPYEQVCALSLKGYTGLVFFTFILEGMGELKPLMVIDAGYSLDQVKRMRKMFRFGKDAINLWCEIIKKYGGINIEFQNPEKRKFYGWFDMK